MNSERIISLCYVSKQNERSKELCRIADFRNGNYEPYTYNFNDSFFGTDRDLIYGSARDISSIRGTFAVFEWNAYQDEEGAWRTSAIESDISWVEILYSFLDKPAQIVEMIKNGIKLETTGSHPHDLIICCREKDASTIAIYVPANALVYVNDHYTFAEGVNFLETGSLSLQGVASCRCRYFQSDVVRYLSRRSCWQAISRIAVRSRQEIIAGVIQNHVRRMYRDGVITRGERQSYLALIGKLSKETLAEEIALQIECSSEEAVRYADRYFAGCEEKLDQNEADWILQRLIENDGAYVQKLATKVEQKWKDEHTAQMREAAEEMAGLRFKAQEMQRELEIRKASIQDQLQGIQLEIKDANATLAVLEEKKSACKSQIQEAEQLRKDIEQQIQERLLSVREDRAKVLVDEAWRATMISPVSGIGAGASKACTVVGDDDAEDIPEVTIDEQMQNTIDAWSALCGGRQRGSDAVAFFLAAHVLRQHLIITGECAESIADLAALTATGRKATKVELCADAKVEEIVRALEDVPHECVCFINGLDADMNVVYAVMHRFANAQFFLVLPHGEALSMEPEGLFTTFLPVLSEEFCACESVTEPERLCCREGLRRAIPTMPNGRQLSTDRVAQEIWFSDGFFAPLLLERCARMRFAVRVIYAHIPDAENQVQRALLTMLYAPLLKCLHKKDIVAKNREVFAILGEKERNRLLAFVGVDGV